MAEQPKEPTEDARHLAPGRLPRGTYIGWSEAEGPRAPRRWKYGVVVDLSSAAYHVLVDGGGKKLLRRHPDMLRLREVYAVRSEQEESERTTSLWDYERAREKRVAAMLERYEGVDW